MSAFPQTARPTLRIDFVSDVVCPWCAVGLSALERALVQVRDEMSVELHFQPFELNPNMAPEGVASAPYLKAKYGLSDDQLAANAARLVERGAAEGFAFGKRTHIWGTFDAHRLLHWAGAEAALLARVEGKTPPVDVHQPSAQHRLKRALIEAYHRDGRNPNDRAVLLDVVAQAGLDVAQARDVLENNTFANEVRADEAEWQQRGVTAVPAAIVNDQYVIAGGQPSEMYAQALRQIAAEVAQGAAGDAGLVEG